MPAADLVQAVLEIYGELDLLAPDGLTGVAEAVISGKIRAGRSHHHYWESRFR